MLLSTCESLFSVADDRSPHAATDVRRPVVGNACVIGRESRGLRSQRWSSIVLHHLGERIGIIRLDCEHLFEAPIDHVSGPDQ